MVFISTNHFQEDKDDKFGKVIDAQAERELFKTLLGFITGSTLGFITGALLMFSMNAQAFDENSDAVCMAKNIYFEAGNRPLAGKVAVAQVVLNRMEHSSYAHKIFVV